MLKENYLREKLSEAILLIHDDFFNFYATKINSKLGGDVRSIRMSEKIIKCKKI